MGAERLIELWNQIQRERREAEDERDRLPEWEQVTCSEASVRFLVPHTKKHGCSFG